jgi:hypothetical protein
MGHSETNKKTQYSRLKAILKPIEDEQRRKLQNDTRLDIKGTS